MLKSILKFSFDDCSPNFDFWLNFDFESAFQFASKINFDDGWGNFDLKIEFPHLKLHLKHEIFLCFQILFANLLILFVRQMYRMFQVVMKSARVNDQEKQQDEKTVIKLSDYRIRKDERKMFGKMFSHAVKAREMSLIEIGLQAPGQHVDDYDENGKTPIINAILIENPAVLKRTKIGKQFKK